MNISKFILKGDFLYTVDASHKITQKVANDDTYIKNPIDLFKERRKMILESLDIKKLEKSVTKSVVSKKDSYSHKELISISMELGKNFSESKSVLVEQLIKIKKKYDEKMKYY